MLPAATAWQWEQDMGKAGMPGRPLFAVSSLLIAVVLVLLWWLLRVEAPGEAAHVVPLAAPAVQRVAAPESGSVPAAVIPEVEALQAERPAPARPRTPPVAPQPTGSLLVRVRWSDRSVAAGVGVRVLDWRRANATELMLRGTSDAIGEVRFPRVTAGNVLVVSDRSEGPDVTLLPGEEQVVELLIPPGFRIAGRVVDEQGAGIADAIVSLSDYFNYSHWHDLVRTDGSGGFVLRDAGAARYVCARAAGYAASDTYQAFEWRDEDLLEIVLRPPCGQVLGTVKGPDGAVVAGAEVSLGADGWPAHGERTDRIPMGPQRMVALSGDDGRFRFGSVPPGTTMLSVRATGFAPFTMSLDVPALVDTPAEVVLSIGCVVAGRVTDAGGQGVAEAWVECRGDREGPQMAVVADEQGRYRLEDLPPGTQTLHASRNKAGKASAEVLCRVDESAEWNPVLHSGTSLSGLVVGRGGEPLAGAWVSLYPAEDPSPVRQKWAFAITEANGAFEAINVESGGAVDVEICPVPGGVPALELKNQPLWTERRVFQVPWSAGAGNVVRGRIVGLASAPEEEVHIGLARSGEPGGAWRARAERDGRFELRDLPDGSFDVSIWIGTLELLARSLELSGGTTTDLGDLIIEHGGLVVAPTFIGFPSAPPPDEVFMEARATDGMRRSYRLEPDGGVWICATILAGEYELSIAGEALGRVRQPVTIHSGETQELHVDLRPGATVTLRVCGFPVAQDYYPALLIREPDGRQVGSVSGPVDDSNCLLLETLLAAGRYVGEVRMGDVVLLTREFEVSAEAQQLVSWTLP